MSISYDRLKKSLFAVVRAANPRLPYMASFRARVVSQTSSDPINDPGRGDLLDVNPDDSRLPPMGGIPLRLGVPGARVQIKSGCHVLVGWADGDPSKPYCWLHDVDDPAIRITLAAAEIIVGGDGAEPTLKGQTYRTAEQALNNQLVTTLTSMAAACTGTLSPLAAGFTALAQAVQGFEGQSAAFLTTIAKVK